MPRVTYESSRYLTLPEIPWPSSGGSGRLHRGRSAGALGLQPEHHGAMATSSPATTPMDEKAPPAIGSGGPAPGTTPYAPSSRRSSLSPSDRTGRRRDSPACIVVEVPPWHRAILNFIEVGATAFCRDKGAAVLKEHLTLRNMHLVLHCDITKLNKLRGLSL
jgi:hypothetical protein